MAFLKKILLYGIIIAAGYGILGYHYIFFGKIPRILKKTKLSLSYTVFSIPEEEFLKSNESILDIDALREAGIGELLVEEGRITREKLEKIEAEYAYESN